MTRYTLDQFPAQTLSVRSVRAMLGVNEALLRWLVRMGHLPGPLYIHGRRYWRPADISAYLERRRHCHR